MNTTKSHIVSALCERLGLKSAPGFYRSQLFLFSLALGAVFWVLLPFLAVVQPLPWLYVFSLSFLVEVFWQPLVEELLFRGFLQGWLFMHGWGQRSLVGVSAANVLTSIVFAGAHIATHSLPWALSTVFPSLLFGALRDRSGSVLPPLALHVVYNAGYFMLTGGSSLVRA